MARDFGKDSAKNGECSNWGTMREGAFQYGGLTFSRKRGMFLLEDHAGRNSVYPRREAGEQGPSQWRSELPPWPYPFLADPREGDQRGLAQRICFARARGSRSPSSDERELPRSSQKLDRFQKAFRYVTSRREADAVGQVAFLFARPQHAVGKGAEPWM